MKFTFLKGHDNLRLRVVLLFTTIVFGIMLPIRGQKVFYNFDIQTDWKNVKEVVDLWSNYLHAPDDSTAAQYWNSEEVKKYGYRNYNLINHIYSPSFHRLAQVYHAQILRVTNKDSLYQITTQFYYPQHDTIQTLCIVDIYVKRESGKFKLYNALPINLKQNWKSQTVGYIHFHYPKEHQFDVEKARKLNDFIADTLPAIFGSKPDTVDYYFTDNWRKLDGLSGLEYNVGRSGEERPSGKSAPNNAVYAVGTGEYYPHEMVHLFVGPLYPGMYLWTGEGIAVYLGGSRGKPLTWHIRRTNNYLQNHPEIDLNNMLDLVTLDDYTEYRYVLGGAIIELIKQKEGWPGVKEFLKESTDKDSYYQAVKKHLGWKRKDINIKFRKMLSRLAAA